MEKQEYIKAKIGKQVMNIEITDYIPDEYVFLKYQKEYAIYCREEVIDGDTHHYFLATNFIL